MLNRGKVGICQIRELADDPNHFSLNVLWPPSSSPGEKRRTLRCMSFWSINIMTCAAGC